MRRLLLALQQHFIDADNEFTFVRTKRRTVQVTLVRDGRAMVSTWEAYKNGELHLTYDVEALCYPPGYDEAVVFNELKLWLISAIGLLNRPFIPPVTHVSKRKELAAPGKHVMNKHERKLMVQLRQKSGKTEAEVRQDAAARRQLAEARALSNKPAGDHVFDGRTWVTPHIAASRAVTKARASGVTAPIYTAELAKAQKRAK